MLIYEQLELPLGPSYDELFAKHKALREHIELAIQNSQRGNFLASQSVLKLALDNDVKAYR
jgi:hypothetical protein